MAKKEGHASMSRTSGFDTNPYNHNARSLRSSQATRAQTTANTSRQNLRPKTGSRYNTNNVNATEREINSDLYEKKSRE